MVEVIDKNQIGSLADQLRSMTNRGKNSNTGANNITTNNTNSDNKGTTADTTKNTSPPKASGISINLNATEILKILITEHFFATSIILVIISVVIASIKYNYDYGVLFNAIRIYLSTTSIGAVILGLIGLFCMTVIMVKINNIIKSNKINEILHNTLRKEVSDLNIIIKQINERYGNINSNVCMISELVSENAIDIRKIINTLESINNTIKCIPDKNTILDILTIRTKLIFSSVIELVAEYLSNIILAGRSKRAFIENRLRNKLDEVKSQYLTEITILSKNTLNNDIRDKVITVLDESFNNILFLIMNTEDINTIDELLSNIGYIVKNLTVTLTNMYDTNLLLTSFFEEEGGV